MNARSKSFYAALCAAAAVLTATGVGVFVLGKPPMTHWVLLAHLGAAPVFAVGLAAVSLTWADHRRHAAGSRFGAVTRALLWLVLLCGLAAILSGVVPMTPIFGTEGQHDLYLTHRCVGIVVAIVVVLHFAALARSRGNNE